MNVTNVTNVTNVMNVMNSDPRAERSVNGEKIGERVA